MCVVVTREAIVCCSGNAIAGGVVYSTDTGDDIRATAWCCGWRTNDPPNVLAVRRQISTETVSSSGSSSSDDI